MESYNSSFIEKENYASNGKANAGLTLGIIGTALSGLGILGGGASMLSNNSTSNKNVMTTLDYVDITKGYYQQRISDLKELTNSFYTLDTKIQNAKDVAAAQAQENFDALNKRIIDLEKSDAVMKATQPLYQQINDLKLNYVNESAMNGIAGANVTTANAVALEAERRQCADNKIVNYCNSTFYPKQIADITTAYTTSTMPIYNPLWNQV